MTSLDEFKTLVGGYFGIQEMDSYLLKEYVLRDIEVYIKNFIAEHNLDVAGLQIEVDKISKELDLKRKLQDSLLVLHKINGPFELELMIKLRLQEIKKGK